MRGWLENRKRTREFRQFKESLRVRVCNAPKKARLQLEAARRFQGSEFDPVYTFDNALVAVLPPEIGDKYFLEMERLKFEAHERNAA